MSVVDPQRIVTMFVEARQRFGEAVLRDPRRLVPMLSDQAPDMRGVIKATAAALAAGAVERLRASRDPAGDIQRIAQEIAASDGLNAQDATTGVHVAAQLGLTLAPPAAPVAMPAMPATPIPRAPAGQTEWVGVSTAVGAPAQTPPPSATPQQAYPNLPPLPASIQTSSGSPAIKWFLGGILVIGIALMAYYYGVRDAAPQRPPQARDAPKGQPPQGQPPQAQPRPPQGQPPQGKPPQGGNLPMIAAPNSGRVPRIPGRDGGQVWIFEFLAPAGQQPVRVLVGVSKQGWGAGIVAVSSMAASEPETLSTPGPFELNRQGNEVFRVLQPSWQRDGLNIGGVCVIFAASNAQDVQLQGSKLCVLSDNCQRIVGCGEVQ